LDYAEQRGIPVAASREKIHSRDATYGTSVTRAANWKTLRMLPCHHLADHSLAARGA